MASKQEWIFQTSETSYIRVGWNIFIFINLVEIFLVFICSLVLKNIVATVIFDDSETLLGISVFILCYLGGLLSKITSCGAAFKTIVHIVVFLSCSQCITWPLVGQEWEGCWKDGMENKIATTVTTINPNAFWELLHAMHWSLCLTSSASLVCSTILEIVSIIILFIVSILLMRTLRPRETEYLAIFREAGNDKEGIGGASLVAQW